MAEIIPVERKSPVLKHPALPCLKRWHTVNLMAGCPYACRYCYARSFRSNPGNERIHFYANTYELLKHELPRKRVKPSVVYFSTACEPFPPYDVILDIQFAVMNLLLENNINLLISTKSLIPERFIYLFKSHSQKVIVQMGLTTTNDTIRQQLEPYTASVRDRFKTLRMLCKNGIDAEARLDPLIPKLTDRDESIEDLLKRIAECGVRTASASYLFLRQAVSNNMNFAIGDWSFRGMLSQTYTHKIERYCGNNSIVIPSASYRIERYERIKSIALLHGITVRFCRCKNPDVTNDCCHPTYKPERSEPILFNL